MKFGFRRPSLRKRIAARTSIKRYVRHSLGFKAPRGWGWLTNPKRAMYNRIYYRTTFGLAMLGEKEAAIRELTRIYDSHRAGMEARSVKEFGDDLQDAKNW